MSRTNIVIDDKLVRQAIQLTGAKTMRQAVDIALRRLVAKDSIYRRVRQLRGKLKWEGDLDEWRKTRA
jgi:Arc/MetJ family transcription regulator